MKFQNIPRDYSKTLSAQKKEETKKGWEYIGVFGRCGDAVLKFLDKTTDAKKEKLR